MSVRHYGNLFELPTLFYAACLTAYLLGGVTAWVLGWASAYAAARVVQSAVHLSYNKPAHRGLAFILGMVCMIALWIGLPLRWRFSPGSELLSDPGAWWRSAWKCCPTRRHHGMMMGK